MCDIFGGDNFTKNHKMVIQFMCQHHIQFVFVKIRPNILAFGGPLVIHVVILVIG
jgi:hypothetical protein